MGAQADEAQAVPGKGMIPFFFRPNDTSDPKEMKP